MRPVTRGILAALAAVVAAGGMVGVMPGAAQTTDPIVKVDEASQGGYHAEFYENRAYSCGESGYQTFVLAWQEHVRTDEPHPLWVRLHGGGAGAFNEVGEYVPGFLSDFLDQETFEELGEVGNQEGALMGRIRAHDDGFRAVIPSLCDHDLYGGIGREDPNNPNPPDENGTRATDGLLATEAAVDFARSLLTTTATFIHGTSAGSSGAFNVAYRLEERGKPVTGIVMDSGLIDHTALGAAEALVAADPEACSDAGFAQWDFDAMRARFAHLLRPVWEPAYAVEQGLFTTPVFQLWDRRDPFFCEDTPIPYVDDDGTQKVMAATDLLNDDFRAAIAAHSPGGPGASTSLRVCSTPEVAPDPDPCGEHIPTIRESTDADTGLDINDQILDWVNERLAAA